MTAEEERHEQEKQGSWGDGDSDPPRKCGMWMVKKRRFCASRALPTSPYCGNHQPPGGETRVPCPIDPSHTILEREVASHVKRCSATKHLENFELQPYFCPGVNAGSDGEEDEVFTSANARDSNLTGKSVPGNKYQSCGAKRAAITEISGDKFWEFVKRIESAFVACCQENEEAIFQPPQCAKWWDPKRDRRLPFQEKHVLQQASLLGNLEAVGLLHADKEKSNNGDSAQDKKKNSIYVEFGAGRGYLSHMLCDSYGVSSVVLVERRAYKFKADRTLRQIPGVSVERLRTDIQDLNLQGIECLQGHHFVAVSKHLCGPATDLTLRCCLYGENGACVKPSNKQSGNPMPILEGIGIATCCHHLCQWRSYVNKEFFRKLGLSISDFNMITWLTSWAVNHSGEHGEPEIEAIVDLKAVRQGALEVADGTLQVKSQLSEAMDSLDVAERAVLGRKCKHIIDYGRLLWLKQHGMDSKIVTYISPEVSPENKLLLACKSQLL